MHSEDDHLLHNKSFFEPWLTLGFYFVVLLFLIFWFSCVVSCGAVAPNFITRQGVEVYIEGYPPLTHPYMVDNSIDFAMGRWAAEFGVSNTTARRLVDGLAEMKLHIGDHDPEEDGAPPGKNGYQQGDKIYIWMRYPCLNLAPFVHEMAHWILWQKTGDPERDHPAGPVWSYPHGWVWETQMELTSSYFCPELHVPMLRLPVSAP